MKVLIKIKQENLNYTVASLIDTDNPFTELLMNILYRMSQRKDTTLEMRNAYTDREVEFAIVNNKLTLVPKRDSWKIAQDYLNTVNYN